MVRKVGLIVSVVALCLASLPGIASAAGPKFTAGAPGLGDPYYPLDGNGGYDVKHYDLDVKYVPDTDRLTGIATITARATQNLSAFNLDFVGLHLRSLKVNGVDARWSRDDGELTVKPRTGLTKGSTFTVVARYDGVPVTLEEFGLSGFIHTPDGAIVIGEPHVAATWFPANDHPRDKASFSFEITVPKDIEAVSNGKLKSEQTHGAWKTWAWDAKEPMATYLAFMAIGQFDIRAYQEDGIKYWDAVDSAMNEDLAPAIPPVSGAQFAYSQMSDPGYKRLTHVVDVPAAGADLSFDVFHDTEPDYDFLFVEVRTVGRDDDWTTLPDAAGRATAAVGWCPAQWHPFIDHYMTWSWDEGDPDNFDDDVLTCTAGGTTGTWNAVSGPGAGWEDWTVHIPQPTGSEKSVEVSITYASDWSVQGQGVIVDDVVISTGQGTTGFEDDGDTLDGWTTPDAPEGSEPNPNTWAVVTAAPAIPGIGATIYPSLDRQPEIIDFESATFGPYPFSASGGVVDEAGVGFALENQTRPTYAPFFFGFNGDGVIVHELAHQWFGDSLAVDTWQHIWLNEGFATYAEWLWSEHEGFGTADEIYASFDDPSSSGEEYWNLPIGDPGPDHLFDGQVYWRGALTLHALRREVGDHDFFRILKAWTRTYAGGNVTTDQFIALSERISHKQLDALFENWLSAGYPDFGLPALRTQSSSRRSAEDLPIAVKGLAIRLGDRPGNPFKDLVKNQR